MAVGQAFSKCRGGIHGQLREVGKHRVVMPPVISRSEVAH